MKERIAVFGAGGGWKEKRNELRERYEVIGIINNDEESWGTVVDGIPVYAPVNLPVLNPDMVFIGVFKAEPVIREQLHTLGYEDARIRIASEPARIFYNRDGIGWGVSEDNIEQTYGDKFFEKHRSDDEDDEFVSKLEELKGVLNQYNIPRNAVAVCSGGILNAFGLRATEKFDDVDLIMISQLRELYGRGIVIVSETTEVHVMDEYDIPDEDIIMNPRYHFHYRGFKFANPDIMYRLRKGTDEGDLLENLMKDWNPTEEE